MENVIMVINNAGNVFKLCKQRRIRPWQEMCPSAKSIEMFGSLFNILTLFLEPYGVNNPIQCRRSLN